MISFYNNVDSTQVNPVLLDDESDNGTTQSQTLLNKDSTQDSGTSASFALVVTSDDIDLQPVLDDGINLKKLITTLIKLCRNYYYYY